MSSSLTNHVNGIHAYIRQRDDVHFEAIASKFELDVADVRKAAYDAEDSIKKPKPIKAQKRQPKSNMNKDGTKPQRKKSGYWFFCKETRAEAVDLLMNNPKERKFKTKDGKVIDVKVSDFEKSGKPSFTHINQKCSSMWWSLSAQERAEWESKVAEYSENERLNPEESKPTKKGKSKATKNNDDEEEEDEEDEEEEEEDEEEEELPPKKATSAKGEGRTQKSAPVKTLAKNTLPPPKGNRSKK